MTLTSSVLIPSYGRPQHLARCLAALRGQRHPADEVLVVWQGDDSATRDVAAAAMADFPGVTRVLHLPVPGIVPAENLALAHASGDIILLIDDDAVAPPDWIARHLAHYADARTGAVGGPADNFRQDGTPFPERPHLPIGTLTWYGRLHGNMHDHPPAWRSRAPEAVEHLVGYNMSLRRTAFREFEGRLRPYWQLFEAEVALQVQARGLAVRFDYANIVRHHPSNPVFTVGRHGDLDLKVYNVAYNLAFVLARHSPWHLRSARWLYLMLVGSTNIPGLLGSAVAIARGGGVGVELGILRRTMRAHSAGWRDGTRTRDELP